ncbi:MAG: hypothetical protein QNJ14_10475 [Woeseiaceae bacterium]|nr:hypothetical protein [Woeseiaceae bacterium]
MSSKKKPNLVDDMDVDGLGVVKPGMKVKHPTFGRGVVCGLAVWDSGERTIGVEFSGHGERWLVPEYANLKKRRF